MNRSKLDINWEPMVTGWLPCEVMTYWSGSLAFDQKDTALDSTPSTSIRVIG